MEDPSDLQKDIEAELREITGEESSAPDLQLLEDAEPTPTEEPEAVGESIDSMVAEIEADLVEEGDESVVDEAPPAEVVAPDMGQDVAPMEAVAGALPTNSGKSELQLDIESEYELITGAPPADVSGEAPSVATGEVSATAPAEEEPSLASEFGIEAASDNNEEEENDEEAFAAEALAMEAEADPIDVPQEEPQVEETTGEEDSNEDYIIDRKPLWEGSDEVNAAEYSADELTTIMNEINDLEEEAKSESPKDLAMTDEDLKKKTALQDEIEAQISAIKPDFNAEAEQELVVEEEPSESLEVSPPPSIEPLAMEQPEESLEMTPPPKVEPLAMEAPPKVEPLVGSASEEPKAPPPAAPQAPGGTPMGMSFGASGQMNLTLNFPVGEKNVQINVDGDKGLTCVLDDFTLNISEEHGLTINIPTNKKAS
jgi:hypothetical protein